MGVETHVVSAADTANQAARGRRWSARIAAVVVVLAVVATAAALATTRHTERTERVAPAARPAMDTPVNGALAPARRDARVAGPSGVGSGGLAPGVNGAAAPAGVRVAPGSSIQAAIDAAGPGGTVVIGAGVHRE